MKKLNNLLFAFILFAISACFDNKDDNIWVVGTSADNPPYEFMQNGKMVGFDIDLIMEIGKRLDKTIEFKNMEFPSLLAALASNNADLIIAGLSVTEDRLKRVEFSTPYIHAKVAILYNGNDKFSKPKDLKNKEVGAQLGSTWSIIAQDLSSVNNFNIHVLSNNLMLIEDLKSKRLDAVVLEEAQADKFIEIYPNFAKFTVADSNSSFAIAMPKNSTNKKIIDHTIKALRNNGTIRILSKKWGLVGTD